MDPFAETPFSRDRLAAEIARARDRLRRSGGNRASRAEALIALGTGLVAQEMHTGPGDGEEATALLGEALRLIPRAHVLRAGAELALAVTQLRRPGRQVATARETLRTATERCRPGTLRFATVSTQLALAEFLTYLSTRDLALWQAAYDRLDAAAAVLDRAATQRSGDVATMCRMNWAMARAQQAMVLIEREDGRLERRRLARARELLDEIEARAPEAMLLDLVRHLAAVLDALDGEPGSAATGVLTAAPPAFIDSPMLDGPRTEATLLRGIAEYGFAGDLQGLDSMIERREREAFGQYDPDPASALAEASDLYQLRSTVRRMSHRPGADDDLRRALELAEQAHACTDRLAGPITALTLGRCLASCYGAGLVGAGRLDEAFDLLHRADHLSPEGSRLQRAVQVSLVDALMLRAYRDVELNDVLAAVEIITRALNGMRTEAPHRPMLSARLAASLGVLADATGHTDDALRASQQWALAVEQSEGVSVLWAYDTAVLWARWALARGLRQESADAHAIAVAAIARLALAQVTRAQAAVALHRGSDGLVPRTMWLLTRSGRLRDAAVAAESGRAVVLCDALQRERAELEDIRLGPLGERYRLAAGRVTELETIVLKDVEE